MSEQTLLMLPPPAVAGRTARKFSSPSVRAKRDIYFLDGPANMQLGGSGTLRVYVEAPAWPYDPVAEFKSEDLTYAAFTQEDGLALEKLAAIKAFRGGMVLLFAGAIVGISSFVVIAPFLLGISAALTIAGGTLAAGATETYRRGR